MINAVIDLSHFEANVDFTQIAGAGILGVIHKATQGSGYADPTYAKRKPLAVQAGLLWGAYHFGDGSDVTAQINNFLGHVQPLASDLLVLDLEQNSQGASMTLAQAEQFVTAIHAATGRWPGLYGGSYLKSQLQGTTQTVLANCWLWYAEYASAAQIPPLWHSWTLWQFTDGANGPQPHSVAGVGNCDRDQFNGDADALRAFWLPAASNA